MKDNSNIRPLGGTQPITVTKLMDKGLYTSHMYRSFCVELRSVPAGKLHVVYLAGVQVASRGTSKF